MPTPAPIQISNREFLEAIFGDQWVHAQVTGFDGDPKDRKNRGRWSTVPAAHQLTHLRPTQNTYFVVSLFDGGVRRLQEWKSLHLLAIDDVGTKVTEAKVRSIIAKPPSYILETSPGNHQWGWILETPLTHGDGAEALLKALKVALVGSDPDPGMGDLNRYLRLPEGTNQKPHLTTPFACRLVFWEPGNKLSLADIDLMLQVQGLVFDWSAQARPSKKGAQPGTLTPLVDPAKIMDDPALQALIHLGLVRGRRTSSMNNSGRDGTFDLTCPWGDEHSDGNTGDAIYVPATQIFTCVHDHCKDRHYQQLMSKLNDLLLEESGGLRSMGHYVFEEVDPAAVPPILFGGLSHWTEDTVHVENRSRAKLWSIRTRTLLDDDDHNTRWGAVLAGRLPEAPGSTPTKPKYLTPARAYRGHPQRRTAYGIVHWPGGEALIERGGKLLVNEWTPLPEPRVMHEVTDEDVKPWLDLVHHVVGIATLEEMEFCEQILDWMALVVGAWEKPGWFVLLIGRQGMGKDLIIQSIVKALGEAMAMEIGGAEIGARFNDYQKSRLLLINELRQTSRMGQSSHDTYNGFKLWDNTRKAARIELKGEQPRNTRNVFCPWITSNEAKPVTLPPDDRRFAVINRLDTPVRKDLTEACWAFLGLDVDQEVDDTIQGWDHVHAWLTQRWANMPDYRRRALMGPAPWSPAKDDLIEASRDEAEKWIENHLGQWHPILSSAFVYHKLTQAARSGDGLNPRSFIPNEDAVGHILSKLGCKKLHGGAQFTIGGRRMRLWVLLDHDFALYDPLPRPDLARVADQMLAGAAGLPAYAN